MVLSFSSSPSRKGEPTIKEMLAKLNQIQHKENETFKEKEATMAEKRVLMLHISYRLVGIPPPPPPPPLPVRPSPTTSRIPLAKTIPTSSPKLAPTPPHKPILKQPPQNGILKTITNKGKCIQSLREAKAKRFLLVGFEQMNLGVGQGESQPSWQPPSLYVEIASNATDRRELQPPWCAVENAPHAMVQLEWRPPWVFLPSLRTRTFFRVGVLI
ncbi:hypothetical protein QVD17_12745 [Tagetes erecta]|uniref:Uncharacterized protein n=1 Tax=Tagetes erecta TaxID=13708 RepID=A0AAD8P328_TARER|nr:hypothetical protein QVD17_12745 [Tagetes erecta]